MGWEERGSKFTTFNERYVGAGAAVAFLPPSLFFYSSIIDEKEERENTHKRRWVRVSVGGTTCDTYFLQFLI